VDMLYICASNTTMQGSIFGPKSTIERTVEGVYLDGKWVNTTWVPSNQSLVGGYWRQGVDIQSTYIKGNLTKPSCTLASMGQRYRTRHSAWTRTSIPTPTIRSPWLIPYGRNLSFSNLNSSFSQIGHMQVFK